MNYQFEFRIATQALLVFKSKTNKELYKIINDFYTLYVSKDMDIYSNIEILHAYYMSYTGRVSKNKADSLRYLFRVAVLTNLQEKSIPLIVDMYNKFEERLAINYNKFLPFIKLHGGRELNIGKTPFLRTYTEFDITNNSNITLLGLCLQQLQDSPNNTLLNHYKDVAVSRIESLSDVTTVRDTCNLLIQYGEEHGLN
jgi:hypothetical protein